LESNETQIGRLWKAMNGLTVLRIPILAFTELREAELELGLGIFMVKAFLDVVEDNNAARQTCCLGQAEEKLLRLER